MMRTTGKVRAFAHGSSTFQSTNPSFKPDPSFMDTRPDFRIVKEFPGAIIYRYDPQP